MSLSTKGIRAEDTPEVWRGFSGDVVDDGTPQAAADIAGQAIRDFNHRTINGRHENGWRYPSDAYRVCGELYYLAGGLGQAVDQVSSFLAGLAEDGRVRIDRGTTWEGDPDGAVAAARHALEMAGEHAAAMYSALTAAQLAINAAAYSGPDTEEDA